MKLLTRQTDYAIRSLVYLAEKPSKIVSIRELQIKLKLPRAFLRRVFQKLARIGIVKATKGPRGGFVLAQPANKITISELMHNFQGKFELSQCLLKKKVCPHIKSCVLRKKIKQVEEQVFESLSGLCILDLIEDKK